MNLIKPNNPILLAIDHTEISTIEQLITQTKDYIGGIKLGLEFWNKYGKEGVQNLIQKHHNIPLFLDLKLHDIPNTVYKGLSNVMELNPLLITIHALGGANMISKAKEVTNNTQTKLITVTILTSLDEDDLASLGMKDIESQILKLTELALNNGADGIVCSPQELFMIRKNFGQDFIIVTPGIRTYEDIGPDDQKRVMPPKEALILGSTYLVIGRPITNHPNPQEKARLILDSLA
ncbi:orotidine-5'-phosphate decarboxylase [Rickettsiales endosymbiont of Stachyamoeba lipophora]|uniref:orotidine-5'-phosphate decarboxylase n=1 Tax=Rickettsiales endosymbiont of Stachyamoeba lipophora TaxID=2486578 RepID=UPI000F64BA5D|nr:orotidine-5'-phosphate decarboxylase [Rickettsiales endosymbiont of Stachyamoeba lipophora]AZL15142.1 orotidine-5'-phosphate decarboxylase [Rickettsiales endosymbiont of Stachyamoeba lipophora]